MRVGNINNYKRVQIMPKVAKRINKIKSMSISIFMGRIWRRQFNALTRTISYKI